MSKPPYNQSTFKSTFIELYFKYEGLPDSKHCTRLKAEQPEDVAMEDAATAKAAGVDEGEVNEEGAMIEGAEAKEREVGERQVEDEEAVPAFGGPLQTAPRPLPRSPAPPHRTLSPTPKLSERFKCFKQRTLKEIDAEEERIDREEGRLRAHRRELREEQR